MNEFIKRLAELRGKVRAGVKGTLSNMSNVREREQRMLDTERARNRQMMRNQFGSVNNYRRVSERDDPRLYRTSGQSLMDFIRRITRSR